MSLHPVLQKLKALHRLYMKVLSAKPLSSVQRNLQYRHCMFSDLTHLSVCCFRSGGAVSDLWYMDVKMSIRCAQRSAWQV